MSTLNINKETIIQFIQICLYLVILIILFELVCLQIEKMRFLYFRSLSKFNLTINVKINV